MPERMQIAFACGFPRPTRSMYYFNCFRTQIICKMDIFKYCKIGLLYPKYCIEIMFFFSRMVHFSPIHCIQRTLLFFQVDPYFPLKVFFLHFKWSSHRLVKKNDKQIKILKTKDLCLCKSFNYGRGSLQRVGCQCNYHNIPAFIYLHRTSCVQFTLSTVHPLLSINRFYALL